MWKKGLKDVKNVGPGKISHIKNFKNIYTYFHIETNVHKREEEIHNF